MLLLLHHHVTITETMSVQYEPIISHLQQACTIIYRQNDNRAKFKSTLTGRDM